MSDEIVENIHKCCRICLDVESDHISILEDQTVHLHLKSCIGVTVSPHDLLPKTICTACVSQLNEFYNFQLNARCSQDWLESSIQEKSKKTTEKTSIVQPLPDSEYNSDSLLEFLNNTANIEEYLNNLGKDDIPSIVNMLDRNNENSADGCTKIAKQPSPKKKEAITVTKNCKINKEMDLHDSGTVIVKEVLKKGIESKKSVFNQLDKNLSCFACKLKFENIQKLSQHISICDAAMRTCLQCNTLFNSKQQMLQHSVSHNPSSLICNCGKQFASKEMLIQHQKSCYMDYTAALGCMFRCKQCKAIFKERFQLYRHAKNHVMKAEERICDICGHSFIGKDNLIAHKQEVHEKADSLMYRCKICTFTSSSHKETYVHVQKHVKKSPLDRHLCETCGQCFTTQSSLHRHTLKHKTAGYKCGVCNNFYKNAETRDKHVLEHVEITMCEKCGQSISSFQLEAHSCL